MLMLSRRVDERVIITAGDKRIVVAVVRICDGKVCLGFDADREITVHRNEVQAAVDRENLNKEDAAKIPNTAQTGEPFHAS